MKISETAAAQYQAMMSLWSAFEAQSEWRIPRPLGYLVRTSALIMEEVQGIPLVRRFPRFVWNDMACDKAFADCQRAGQWLRFYHGLGSSDEMRCLADSDYSVGLKETLSELQKAGFDESICPVIRMSFAPLAERVLGKKRPVATLHGDYTIDNIVLNGNSVIVFDLAGQVKNIIDRDIAAFLNSILMLRFTRTVPSLALDGMRRAFLRGYFGRDEWPSILICLLQGIGLADIALEIAQRRRSRLAHFWLERMVRRALQSIMADVEKCQ